MTSAEKLRKIRKERNLTQKKVAAMVGISRSTLSHYENNTYAMSKHMCRWLANALNVPITDIASD